MLNGGSALPVLFFGHGSPMNAIAANAYTDALAHEGSNLPRPSAILVASAHWVTRGTRVQKLERPKTIHDFRGFPEELYRIQYPAPGAPQTADRVAALLRSQGAETDSDWGLDHGTWSVLRHMYPSADVPVLQLRLNANLGL